MTKRDKFGKGMKLVNYDSIEKEKRILGKINKLKYSDWVRILSKLKKELEDFLKFYHSPEWNLLRTKKLRNEKFNNPAKEWRKTLDELDAYFYHIKSRTDEEDFVMRRFFYVEGSLVQAIKHNGPLKKSKEIFKYQDLLDNLVILMKGLSWEEEKIK